MMFPHKTERFFLAGPVGQLELATTYPVDTKQKRVIVICHPHPLQGGTMDNKVVTTLMRTFNEMSFATVRFNYRGVGQSEGNYADGIGETDDLLAILDWVTKALPDYELWLAGFSFGCYVSYRAATITPYKDMIKQLISVAPPASYPEFSELPAPTMPWLVVQGEQDEVVDPATVFAWLATFAPPPTILRFADTGHFFHGKLIEMKQKLQQVFA